MISLVFTIGMAVIIASGLSGSLIYLFTGSAIILTGLFLYALNKYIDKNPKGAR